MKKTTFFNRAAMLISLGALVFSSCDGDIIEGRETIVETVRHTPAVTLEISSEADLNSASVIIIPNTATKSFVYALGSASDLENFLAGRFPGTERSESSEPIIVEFDGLEEDTFYTVFAQAYGENGEPGSYSTLLIKTFQGGLEVEPYFLGSRSVCFLIETNGEIYHTFAAGLGTAADKELFISGDLEGMISKPEKPVYYATYFDLEPATDYILYLKCFDRTGQETQVFEIPVRTEAEGDCPGGELVFDYLDMSYGDYVVNANDKTGSIAVIFNESGFFDVDLDDIYLGNPALLVSGYVNYYGMYAAGRRLEFSASTATIFEPEYEYEIYVLYFGTDDEVGSVERFRYTTPAVDNTLGKAQVELTLDEYDSGSAKYTVTFGENTICGYFEIIRAAWLTQNNYTLSDLPEILISRGYFLHHRQAKTYTYTDNSVVPETDYYVAVLPINANGPNYGGSGEVVYIPFKTPAVPDPGEE